MTTLSTLPCPLLSTLLGSLILLSNLASAQPDEDSSPKWYQVELFIFANNNPNAANQEAWQQDLGLKYPLNIINLESPNTELAQSELTSPELTDTAVLNNQGATSSNNEMQQLMPGDSQSSDGNTALEPTITTEHAEQQPDTERPFVLLDPEQHQLTSMVRRILSRADFRLLFHQAWRQPINNNDNAENILIRAGDQFDTHYELEGSIKLSVERYLHINTDLWLSTFVSAIGREQAPWPVLPKAPVFATERNNSSNLHSFNSQSLGGHNSGNYNSGNQGLGNQSFNDQNFNNQNFNNQASTPLRFENPFLDLVGNQYSVERTIALRQHRRMRSNELHYIDHPLMGLLIKVTPYTLPEPETADETEETVDKTEIAPSTTTTSPAAL